MFTSQVFVAGVLWSVPMIISPLRCSSLKQTLKCCGQKAKIALIFFTFRAALKIQIKYTG